MRRTLWLGAVLGGLLALLWFGQARAQDLMPTAFPSDNDVNAVAKDLYCPVCENTPLDVCPTQACKEWRDLIRLKLSEGWNEEQIKDYFVEQYGDRVVAAPPLRGLNWLAYIIPPLAAVAGVGFLVTFLRKARKNAPAAVVKQQPDRPAEQDDYLRRMEEELKKRA